MNSKRLKHSLLCCAIMFGLDIASNLLFGPTGVNGFQLLMASFALAWATEEEK